MPNEASLPKPEDVIAFYDPAAAAAEATEPEEELPEPAVPDEPTVWPPDDAFISCVMPTTSKRRWCIERSLRCWQRQTWQHRELLVVHDGPGTCEDLVAPFMAADPRIRYVHLEGERLLGMKYNEAIELVKGPYVALWADDDWHHSARLEAVMRAMIAEKCEVGGTTTMLVFRERDKQVFHYWSTPLRPYLVSGTMVFAKHLWDETKFPNLRRGSDTHFANGMLSPVGNNVWKRWAIVNDPRLYCAFIHGGNTGNPLNDSDALDNSPAWQKLSGYEGNLRRWIEEPEAYGVPEYTPGELFPEPPKAA